MNDNYIKGRGSQIKPDNPYLKASYSYEDFDGIDEPGLEESPKTRIFYEYPKKIVNKVDSPDLGVMYSINPYQGCEHGCIYCYARNAHEYWGFGAGLDFETKIIVKPDAPRLLENFFLDKKWSARPIMLSGNTDCYQPLERKLGITRKLLEVFAKYRHPVSVLTKNVSILRDKDVLMDLARDNLVHVGFSITTLDEKLRSVLEPRTASAQKKLKALATLAEAGIPVSIMNAPIIPGLNHHEIPAVIEAAADHGALSAGYTVVRLNGSIGEIFKDWLQKNFPQRFGKVWNQIASAHGGRVNDSQWHRRIIGDGQVAETIGQLFRAAKKKYMGGRSVPPFDLTKFRRGGTFPLFT